MRKTNRMALFLLSGAMALFNQPIYSMEKGEGKQCQQPGQKLLQFQEGIKEAVQTTRANMATHQGAEGSVIVVGTTGSGKSALITYLAGRSLVAKKERGKYSLDLQNPEDALPGFAITSGCGIGTELPTAWRDQTPEHDVVYWDSSGFSDPRGSKQEIINSFSLYELFSSSSPIKIVIVENESSIIEAYHGRGGLDTLHKITEFFPYNDQLTPGLSLVITHQREDISGLVMALQEILGGMRRGNYPQYPKQVEDVLGFLVDNAATRVSSFPYPNASGVYNTQHRNEILLSIQSSQYIQKPIVSIPMRKLNNDDETNRYLSSILQTRSINRPVA